MSLIRFDSPLPPRDHGVPGYIRYREICQVGGGRKVRKFSDLGTNISREVRTNTVIASYLFLKKNTKSFISQKINRLRRVYKSVEDIDLFVGLYLEDPGFNGALVGQTFLCLIGDQVTFEVLTQNIQKIANFFFLCKTHYGFIYPAKRLEGQMLPLPCLSAGKGLR